jgi:hypothetical protein
VGARSSTGRPVVTVHHAVGRKSISSASAASYSANVPMSRSSSCCSGPFHEARKVARSMLVVCPPEGRLPSWRTKTRPDA